jgi:hypothetical protein
MPSMGGGGTACAIGIGDAGDATSDSRRMNGDGGGRGEVQLHVSSSSIMMALGTKVNFGGPQNRRRASPTSKVELELSHGRRLRPGLQFAGASRSRHK